MLHVSHFLFTPQGDIAQVPTDIAADVASGERPMPQFADNSLRYLQVIVDHEGNKADVQVRTAGALVHFDPKGCVREAGIAMGERDGITRFEHDTCVQLALDGLFESQTTHH
ncbi:MAG: hypothetical protein ACPHCJ_03465 [Oceanococcaceae bacterium]